MYGEGDVHFFPTLLRVAHKYQGQIPRIAGVGGKQQLTYVGNAAWAHIRAKNSLGETEGVVRVPGTKIGGLSAFITDDTPIEDTIRFCQRISNASTSSNDSTTARIKLRPSWWSIPAVITYFLALLLEIICRVLHFKVDFPPRGMISYLSSIIMYSRLRASIHLDYEPIFNEEKSILNSVTWYEKWYREHLNRLDKKRLSLEKPPN